MADHDCGGDVVAFIFGGLLGAGVALLLAPRSGEETRERLVDWLEEGRRRTKEYLDEKVSSGA
jgi:gas vesicle protein